MDGEMLHEQKEYIINKQLLGVLKKPAFLVGIN
jgi:hypothetical protein